MQFSYNVTKLRRFVKHTAYTRTQHPSSSPPKSTIYNKVATLKTFFVSPRTHKKKVTFNCTFFIEINSQISVTYWLSKMSNIHCVAKKTLSQCKITFRIQWKWLFLSSTLLVDSTTMAANENFWCTVNIGHTEKKWLFLFIDTHIRLFHTHSHCVLMKKKTTTACRRFVRIKIYHFETALYERKMYRIWYRWHSIVFGNEMF